MLQILFYIFKRVGGPCNCQRPKLLQTCQWVTNKPPYTILTCPSTSRPALSLHQLDSHENKHAHTSLSVFTTRFSHPFRRQPAPYVPPTPPQRQLPILLPFPAGKRYITAPPSPPFPASLESPPPPHKAPPGLSAGQQKSILTPGWEGKGREGRDAAWRGLLPHPHHRPRPREGGKRLPAGAKEAPTALGALLRPPA